jgi:hypothetical protein
MIKVTSDGGNLFGFQWFNSIQSIDLAAADFNSPCGRFAIQRAIRQSGRSTYWGGFSLGRFVVIPSMSLCGPHWIGNPKNRAFVTVSGGGALSIC